MRSKRRPNNSNHGLLKKQVRKTVRKYLIDKYGVDPPVINRDQMPLHRNESATQKTLSLQSDSHLPKKSFIICFKGSPSKMMKNAFYFILKALFVLKIFKFLS